MPRLRKLRGGQGDEGNRQADGARRAGGHRGMGASGRQAGLEGNEGGCQTAAEDEHGAVG